MLAVVAGREGRGRGRGFRVLGRGFRVKGEGERERGRGIEETSLFAHLARSSMAVAAGSKDQARAKAQG